MCRGAVAIEARATDTDYKPGVVSRYGNPRFRESRRYDCFLSYASEDAEVAERIFAFLSQSGMNVFFDKERLASGQPVVEELAKVMAQSKSCLVLLSPRSIRKDYVRHEITCAGRQTVSCSGAFRFVGVLLETFDPSSQMEFIGNFSWLDLPGGDLSIPAARKALLSVRRGESLPEGGQPQVYVSCSWARPRGPSPRLDPAVASRKKRFLDRRQLRPGHSYREEGPGMRIRRIMSSCSGFLAIYPWRTDSTKSPEENYRYFPDELALARDLALPVKGFCVDLAQLPHSLAGPWTVVPKQGASPRPRPGNRRFPG